MATRNDITGDELKTGSANDAYREGWERIFGKKTVALPTIEQLRSVMPARIAEEIVSVQPMDEAGKALGDLYQILKDNPGKHLVITSGRPQLQADIAGYPETDEGNAPD